MTFCKLSYIILNGYLSLVFAGIFLCAAGMIPPAAAVIPSAAAAVIPPAAALKYLLC